MDDLTGLDMILVVVSVLSFGIASKTSGVRPVMLTFAIVGSACGLTLALRRLF